MRAFLLDAALRQNNELRLLLLNEEGDKYVLTCTTSKRIIYVVPIEQVTSEWIDHVLYLLQKFSGGTPRHFTHRVVTRRYLTPSGALTDPIEVLRVECSGHLTFSPSESDRITAIFGLSTPLLEHVLIEQQLRGWLDFEPTCAIQQHRRVFITTDFSNCIQRCTEQTRPPSLRTVAVYRRSIDAFSFLSSDGRKGDWLEASELVEAINQIDPAAICVHGKHVLVGVHLTIPFILVDTASFAKEYKLCYTKELDDAVPVVSTSPVAVDDDGYPFEPIDVEPIASTVDGLERCRAIYSIVERTNAIDLTLEVAALTGQPWTQTLRLESKLGRVEWMIMNFFYDNACVIPNPRRYTAPQQYTAGLVLDAEVGIHHDVILLDFRSLYPSVVVEYKLCWSADGLVLPRMLEFLIDHRKKLADQPNTEVTRLCLKLLANTTYGALAYPAFRFYSPSIASTITARGRQALQDTVEVVQTQFPCKVIYGDTDSVFVTAVEGTDHDALARSIVDTVNERYTKLELEYEALYDSLLLLGKKCYVAYRGEKAVVKGLKMVKKQYFAAGKKICQDLIDALRLTPSVVAVHASLYEQSAKLVEDLRENRLRRGELMIVNMLSRRLGDYVNTAGLYHVLAAKASHHTYERGDYVRYIMFEGCAPVSLEMIDELPPMPVDFKWYCVQLHGMIEQILRVLPDYNREPLAQLLLHGDVQEVEPVEVEYVPRERQPLYLTCSVCKSEIEHWGLAKLEERLTKTRCDTITHLSPRCLFIDEPVSAKIFIECAACACRLDLARAVREASANEDLAASLHANYDCMRVARQVDCRRCRRSLIQFFRSTDIMNEFSALCVYLVIS